MRTADACYAERNGTEEGDPAEVVGVCLFDVRQAVAADDIRRSLARHLPPPPFMIQRLNHTRWGLGDDVQGEHRAPSETFGLWKPVLSPHVVRGI